jgi:hypothetical protein
LQRENERIRLKEPRNKSNCRGKMNEFAKAFSFLVQLELTDRLAMKAEVMTSLGLVPSTVCLVWLMRGAIKPARLSRCTAFTLR